MSLAPPPSSRSSRRQRSLLRDFVEVVVIAVVLYLVISVAFQTVRVEGSSMVPTLQTQDLLLATKISYHLHDPERGDIIVLLPPTEQRDFIKRVIGVPGDTIEIDGNYVDPRSTGPPAPAVLIKPGGQGPWQRLAEPYLPEPWTQYTFCCHSDGKFVNDHAQPLTLPKGMYFVMGDNRNASSDSRLIGLIPRANILAKAWIRMYPFSRAGGLGSGPTLVPAAEPAAIPLLPLALFRRRHLRSLRLGRRRSRDVSRQRAGGG